VNEERIRMVQPRDQRIITPTRFQSFAKTVLARSNAERGARS